MPRRRTKKKPGRKPGKRIPSSPAFRAANRIRAWKHGRRAQTVTAIEVLRSRLEKASKGAPDLVERFTAAVINGDISAIDPVIINGLVDSELMRQLAVEAVQEKGILIEENLVGADGKVVGSRLKQNPAAELALELGSQLGMTAQDQLLSRKSRGEGAKDLAITERLRRDTLLRGLANKGLMPAPPPIETVAVDEEAEG